MSDVAASRAFYVIQGSLQIRGVDAANSGQVLQFPDSDDGLREFDDYLKHNAFEPSLVLIDVIEEVFTTDAIPKLGFRDRRALLDRRVRRKFPRTPYRLSVCGKAALLTAGECPVVHSAVTNHELLDPWISIMLRHRVPLTGIFSVPLMAPKMLGCFYKSLDQALFITQHQGDKLRQSFVQDGLVKSARLSQSPDVEDDDYPGFIVTEVQRSRRYLERSRLLSGIEQLDVCLIVDRRVSDRISSTAQSDSPLQFHFIDPKVAERRLRAGTDVPLDRLETLYIASALRARPPQSYATSGEQRYWRMSRLRNAAIGAALTTAAACSVLTGVYVGDAWRLHSESTTIDAQVTQLSETYRRENEELGPIRADSYDMKLAVDTGDYILEQRVPVPWVMQQLGAVLGDYPDVGIRELSWQADTDPVDEPVRPRPGEPARPVPIPAVRSVSAKLSGTIEPFDGNLRAAFARIDRLVADLESRTAFVDVAAIEYPIDASPRASIAGELGQNSDTVEARFQLRLTYTLPAPATEAHDDPV